MIRRGSRIVVEILGVVLAGSAILFTLLAWRLSSGPVEADFLTPYLESAMSEGRVRLSLGSTRVRWDGFARPLSFIAVNLRLEDENGNTVASVPEAELALNVPRLLLGRMAPERIDLVRPKLHVTRTPGGELTFTLGEDDGVGGDEQPPQVDVVQSLLAALRASPDAADVPMASLRRLEITGGEIIVDDRLLGVTWAAPRAEVTLVRGKDEIRGGMSIDLQIGERLAALTADLNYSLATSESSVQLGLANFVPAELAGLDPLMAPLAMAAAPVNGTITAGFGPGFAPDRIVFVLQGGAGHLRLADVYGSPLPVAGLAVSGLVDMTADRLFIDRFSVDLGGPRLRGSATVVDVGGVLGVDAQALVENLPTDLLATYWPEALAPRARSWVTRNLSLGMVRSAGASISAQIPADRPGDGDVTGIGGSIVFDGVRVNYLNGLPPVDDVAGSAAFDSESFTLALNAGRLRDLSMTSADIAITGFDRPVQTIDIELVLAGPAKTALEVIDSPRLGYMSKLGIDPGATSGTMAGRVRFNFPLIGGLTFDQVGVAAAANLVDVGISDMALGPITGINGVLNLDGRGMTVAGNGVLSDIPLAFEWAENFVADRAFRTRIVANAEVDKAQVDRLGFDFYGPWSGALGVEAVYTDIDRRRATVSAELDLAQATVRLDEIGWQKRRGDPGGAAVEITLENDRLAAIPSFAVDSAGLHVQGSAAFDAGTGAVSEIQLAEFRHGETDLSAELTQLPDGGYAVNAHGPRLDARPLLDRAVSALSQDGSSIDESAAEDEELIPLQVTVAFDEVVAGDGGRLYGVSGIAARDRVGWNEFDLMARTDTGGQVLSRYEPVSSTAHQFSLNAEDAGAALRALDFTENIRGGRLSITGVQDERGGLLRGSIELDEYRAVDMPALGRLLAALSLGGLQNVLSTEGLTFQKLTGQYTFADDVLSLHDTHTSGGALGLTMNGEYDLNGGQLNMEGTIVPIYGVNRLIGAIPVLGALLTGGTGQGVFAFAYSVRGPLREPEVTVNPLSVLAPGFLRNLFFLDSQLGQPAETEESRPRPRLNDE